YRLVRDWPAGAVVDMGRQTRQLAMRLSAHLLFGREEPARAEALGGMIDDLLHRGGSPGVWLFPVNLPGTPYRGLLRNAERIEHHLREVLRERRAHPGPTPDLLDTLIRA